MAPVTSAELSSARNADTFGLGLNFAQTGVTKTETTNQTKDLVTNKVTSATSDLVRTRQVTPGAVPTVDTQGATPAISASIPSTFAADLDPSLQYRLATALFQEIQLLNSYVAGQVTADDEVAFLMRAQISVRPYARQEPVDVHTRLWVDHVSMDPQGREQRKSVERVVPLLIVDNMERSSAKKTAQAILDLDAKVTAMAGGIGAGLGAGTTRERLKEIAGADYNSLVSVSQTARGELLVRLGAMRAVSSKYELPARSYDVTFLVILKKEDALADSRFSVGEYSLFRDATNGNIIPMTSMDRIAKLQKQVKDSIIASHIGSTKEASPEITIAESCLRSHDDFSTPCSNLANLNYGAYSLILDYFETSSATYSMTPVPEWHPVMPPPQFASMVDRPNAGATVELSGARSLNGDGTLLAYLLVGEKGFVKNIADEADLQAKRTALMASLEAAKTKVTQSPERVDRTVSDILDALQDNTISSGWASALGGPGKPYLLFVSQSAAMTPEGGVGFNFPSPAAHLALVEGQDAGKRGAAATGIKSPEYLLLVVRRKHERVELGNPFVATGDPLQLLAASLASAETVSAYPVALNTQLSKPAEAQIAFEVTQISKALKIDAAGGGSFRMVLERADAPGNLVTGYRITVGDADLANVRRVDVPAKDAGAGVVISAAKNAAAMTLDGVYEVDVKNLADTKPVTFSVVALNSSGKPLADPEVMTAPATK
ncbi:MAG TPA: hypothetical protein VGO52_26705 [Hyphomonadaceae bacterium]|nr:hypothetical protein [Hyphomonadaceae bacterium]